MDIKAIDLPTVLSIVSIFIAGASLLLSSRQHMQDKNRSEYDKKTELKDNLNQLFEELEGYCPAIWELYDENIKMSLLYWDKKEKMLLDVNRVFGESARDDLEKIFDSFEKEKNANNAIKRLLDSLENEDKERLRGIIEKEFQFDFDEYSEDDLAYLKRIECVFEPKVEHSNRSKYNFYDLKTEWKKMHENVCKKIKDFNEEIENKIKFN